MISIPNEITHSLAEACLLFLVDSQLRAPCR